jgi:hypothetical protein
MRDLNAVERAIVEILAQAIVRELADREEAQRVRAVAPPQGHDARVLSAPLRAAEGHSG